MVGGLFRFLPALVTELHGCQCQILQYRHMRVQIELLEHHGQIVTDDLGPILSG